MEPPDFAQDFVMIWDLVSRFSSDAPVGRWLEYQGYYGFTSYVIEKEGLPHNFDLFSPTTESIQEWIAGRVPLPKNLKNELRRLLLAMKASGSDVFDKLCRFYCAYKAQLDAAGTTVSVALTIAELKAILVSLTGDAFFFCGIPVTTFAVLVIKFGILDKLCDCKKYATA